MHLTICIYFPGFPISHFLPVHVAKATTSIPAKPLDDPTSNAEWTNNAIKEMKRD